MSFPKKIFVLVLINLTLCFSLSFCADIKIKVDNELVNSDVAPFIFSSTTYVPIRFISSALNIKDISWDDESKTVTIKNGNEKVSLTANQNYAYVNEKPIKLDNSVLLVNGRTFVPVRFIAEAFGAKVTWIQESSTVVISSENSSTTSSVATSRSGSRSSVSPSSSSNVVQPDAVYWLSRIIEAEAGAEPYAGKVAVGEVILNRVACKDFPNTIWGVIFDTKYGIQFEPISNGSIYNTPSSESIRAAKEALSGSTNYAGNSLYFLNPRKAQSSWIIKNREFYTTISNHDFYL